MQIAQESAHNGGVLESRVPGFDSAPSHGVFAGYKIIRCDGAFVGYAPHKVLVAMIKAFLAGNGSPGAVSAQVRELVSGLTESVVGALMHRQPQGGTFPMEDVQDQVEPAPMRSSARAQERDGLPRLLSSAREGIEGHALQAVIDESKWPTSRRDDISSGHASSNIRPMVH